MCAVGEGWGTVGGEFVRNVDNEMSGHVVGPVVQSGSIGSVHVTASPGSEPRGLHWVRVRNEPQSAPTVKGGTDVTPYLPRDRDAELRDLLGAHAFVLVTGSPLSGKTSSAWAAVKEAHPDRLLCAPPQGADLRTLPGWIRRADSAESYDAALHDAEPRYDRYVLWLDDLTEYLGPGGLDRDLLAQLERAGVLIVATMSDADYGTYRFGPDGHGQLLSSAMVVRIGERWSAAERTRLAESPNPRHRAVRDEKDVTKYLAVGPELWEEWCWAGEAGEHLRGHLLVRAALDVARCGYRGPVPLDQLAYVYEAYEEFDAATGMETEEEALAWATKVRHRVTGMLVQGMGTACVHGALLGGSVELRGSSVPSKEAWVTASHFSDEADRGAIWDAAEKAHRHEAEAGDGSTMHWLGQLMELNGGTERGLGWYLRATEAGYAFSNLRAGIVLADSDAPGRAIPYLEDAAAAGSNTAAALLGKLHLDRARHWLGVAADGGDPESAHRLGSMLVGAGQEGEAARRYRQAAEHDSYRSKVATSLGSLLHDTGEPEEAESWYRLGVEEGDMTAVHNLAMLLSGRSERAAQAEAVTLYRRAARHGHPYSMVNLGILLINRGMTAEGRDCIREAADSGDAYAACRLGLLLLRDGNPTEARKWFRTSAEGGYLAAAKALADLETTRTPAEAARTQDTGHAQGVPHGEARLAAARAIAHAAGHSAEAAGAVADRPDATEADVARAQAARDDAARVGFVLTRAIADTAPAPFAEADALFASLERRLDNIENTPDEDRD